MILTINKTCRFTRSLLMLLLVMTLLWGCRKQSVLVEASPFPGLSTNTASLAVTLSDTQERTLQPTRITPTPADKKIPTRAYITPIAPLPIYQTINIDNFEQLQKVNEVRLPILSNLFATYPNEIQLVFPRGNSPWVILPTEEGIKAIDLENNSVMMDLSTEGLSSANYIISMDYRFVGDVDFDEKKIKIWDLTSRTLAVELLYLADTDLDLIGSFSSDSQYLAVAHCAIKGNLECLSGVVNIYDLETQEMIWELRCNQADVKGVGFSSNQNIIMTGIGEKIRDADLLIWDFVENRREFESSGESDEFPLRLATNSSNHTFITFPFIGDLLTLWDANKLEEIGTVEVERICCAKYMPDESSYVVASRYGKLLLGSLDARSAEASTDLNWIANLFISPDGRFIYLLDGGGLLQKWGVIN